MDLVHKYFPNLEPKASQQFSALGDLYSEWNERINVVSRKDISHLYERHVLHSLAIAKVLSFTNGSRVLDVGTGGGFPAIPLAILFPNVRLVACDSIGKKIKVVTEISQSIGLKNIDAIHSNVKQMESEFDFVVSRAVMQFENFVPLVRKRISRKQRNPIPNGILYLKGGDLNDELAAYKGSVELFNISDFFEEEFFETKKVVYLPV